MLTERFNSKKYIPTQEDIASAYKLMDEKQIFLSNSREHILKSLESNKDRVKIEHYIGKKINKLENEKK
uniref:Uncharacterized protein n=1 Tax=candidate division CPR3 bacterium TaxID=2268181 RepID=A0A7C4R3N5_UNCC3